LRIHKNTSDALHLNDSLRKIPGQGMPMFKKDTFGDLFIRFNLVIPKSLEIEKLNILKQVFDEIQEPLTENYSKEFLLENVTETDLEDFESESSESDSESYSDESVSVSSVSSDSEKDFKRRIRKR
jgi:DnaJ-class molecular chaperone